MIPIEEIIIAYTQGYFPMSHPEENNKIYWHQPKKRGIIPLDHNFTISKNLKKLYEQNKFELRQNHSFEQVIKKCSERKETWISDEIIETYCQLHKKGIAYSFEAWQNGNLAGGLYGVAIKKAFFGESMFYEVSNASKIALIFLVETLRHNNFILLDSQYINNHILQFGAYEVAHQKYMQLLNEALI
ncbi:MAG: leucyl/phenylalanyl-tRNA--protein transferase [Bacteroidia bacterium]|nr:leucyl/phenylalanyl-tRNA--protein transferase [Bacteroidia bacterium]